MQFLNSEASLGEFDVHGIDLWLVNLLADVSFQLEGWRQYVVLNTERICGNESLFRFLETVQFAKHSKALDFLHDNFLEVHVLVAEHLLPVLTGFGRPCLQLVSLGHDNGHTAVLERVAIHQALSNVV